MTDQNEDFEIEIEIEDAQDDFVRIADIDGRNILVFPTAVKESKGDDPYPFLLADVIVLDGQPTELMPEIPAVVTKMQLTSAPMIRNGERVLEKANRLNKPYAAPFAGKVNSRKGQKGGKAYGIEAWEKDAPIRTLANREGAKFIKARETAVSEDAFT